MTKRQELSEEAMEAWENPLAREEFDRRLALALAETEEIESHRELIAWFRRRYPTAKDRLAYVRRKYEEWTRPSTRENP